MDSKGLVAIPAAPATVVAVFSILAQCSVQTSKIEADPRVACIEGGGTWVDSVVGEPGHCVKPS